MIGKFGMVYFSKGTKDMPFNIADATPVHSAAVLEQDDGVYVAVKN